MFSDQNDLLDGHIENPAGQKELVFGQKEGFEPENLSFWGRERLFFRGAKNCGAEKKIFWVKRKCFSQKENLSDARADISGRRSVIAGPKTKVGPQKHLSAAQKKIRFPGGQMFLGRGVWPLLGAVWGSGSRLNRPAGSPSFGPPAPFLARAAHRCACGRFLRRAPKCRLLFTLKPLPRFSKSVGRRHDLAK